MFRVQKSLACFASIVALFLLMTIYIVYILIIEIFVHDNYDIILIFKTSAFVFCAFIYGHTFIKRYEIVQLINGYNCRIQEIYRTFIF